MYTVPRTRGFVAKLVAALFLPAAYTRHHNGSSHADSFWPIVIACRSTIIMRPGIHFRHLVEL